MAEKKKSEDTGKSDAPEQQEGPENPALLGEIEQGPSKLEEFLDAHQKKLFCLVGLLIVGVSGFIIVDGLKEKKEVDAGQALVSSKDREDFENLILCERPVLLPALGNPLTTTSNLERLAQLATVPKDQLSKLLV